MLQRFKRLSQEDLEQADADWAASSDSESDEENVQQDRNFKPIYAFWAEKGLIQSKNMRQSKVRHPQAKQPLAANKARKVKTQVKFLPSLELPSQSRNSMILAKDKSFTPAATLTSLLRVLHVFPFPEVRVFPQARTELKFSFMQGGGDWVQEKGVLGLGASQIPEELRKQSELTDLDKARRVLALTAAPKSLACRESERETISGFVRETVQAGEPVGFQAQQCLPESQFR